MKIDIALEVYRAGEPGAFGNEHGSASGTGTIVDRFPEGFGIGGNAIMFPAVIGNGAHSVWKVGFLNSE